MVCSSTSGKKEHGPSEFVKTAAGALFLLGTFVLLAWIERTTWIFAAGVVLTLLWILLKTFWAKRTMWRVLMVLATCSTVLVATDGLFRLGGFELLGERLQRRWAYFWNEDPFEDLWDYGDCPRFQYKPGQDRDANGWLRLQTGGKEETRQRLYVIGDSVASDTLAQSLVYALETTGTAAEVVDTTVGGYNQLDQECILDHILQETPQPDLIIYGICLNDFRDFGIRLNLGAGTRNYVWGASFEDRLDRAGYIPLLMESNTPWVEQQRLWIEERWGDAAVFDFADPDAFMEALARNAALEENLHALERVARTLHERNIPHVIVPFPFNYRADPDPLKPLYSEIVQRLKQQNLVWIDLTGWVQKFRYEDLAPLYLQSKANHRALVHPSLATEKKPATSQRLQLDTVHFKSGVMELFLFQILRKANEHYPQKAFGRLLVPLWSKMVDGGLDPRLLSFADPKRPQVSLLPHVGTLPEDFDGKAFQNQNLPGGFRVVRIRQDAIEARFEVADTAGKIAFSLRLFVNDQSLALRELPRHVRLAVDLPPETSMPAGGPQAVEALGDRIEKALLSLPPGK